MTVPLSSLLEKSTVRSTLAPAVVAEIVLTPSNETGPTRSDWVVVPDTSDSICNRPPLSLIGVESPIRLVVPLATVSIANVPPALIWNSR
jgi:hypothetical protein